MNDAGDQLRWLVAQCSIAFSLEDEAAAAWELGALSPSIAENIARDAEERLADAVERIVRLLDAAALMPILHPAKDALLAFLTWRVAVSRTALATLALGDMERSIRTFRHAEDEGHSLHHAAMAALYRAQSSVSG